MTTYDTDFDVKKVIDQNKEILKFNFPVERKRIAKATINEPSNFTTKINFCLDKVAGNIAYNELKYKVKGAIIDPPTKPKGNGSFLKRSSTLSGAKLSDFDQSPRRPSIGSVVPEPSPISSQSLEFKAPQLIKFALDQIEQDTINAMIKNGKSKQLTDIEKGRLAVKFMSKKNKPLSNRYFYEHFYKEHEKSEKIQILEDVSTKLVKILEKDNNKELLEFLQQNYCINDLKLSQQQKQMLLKRLREDEQRVQEEFRDVPQKKRNVKADVEELVDVMSNHKLNALYSSENLQKNIEQLNQEFQSNKIIGQKKIMEKVNRQRKINDRLSNRISHISYTESDFPSAFCQRIGDKSDRNAKSQGGARISQYSLKEGLQTQRVGIEMSQISSNVQLSQNNLPSINYSDKEQILNELKGYKMRKSWGQTAKKPPMMNREARKLIQSQNRDRQTFNSKYYQNKSTDLGFNDSLFMSKAIQEKEVKSKIPASLFMKFESNSEQFCEKYLLGSHKDQAEQPRGPQIKIQQTIDHSSQVPSDSEEGTNLWDNQPDSGIPFYMRKPKINSDSLPSSLEIEIQKSKTLFVADQYNSICSGVTNEIATYKNISSQDRNKMSKKGQILALIPQQRNLNIHSLQKRKCLEQVQNVIVNSTLFVNENTSDGLSKYISEEQDLIDQKIAKFQSIPEAGISADLKKSKYDIEKSEKIANVKALNHEFIALKHQTWMKNLGSNRTRSERQENERETRRKIQMEKMQLAQFGEIEGCLKQMDRLKELDKLFKTSTNLAGNRAKKMKQMLYLKKLKQAQDKNLEFK